jgi:hypothetical protein
MSQLGNNDIKSESHESQGAKIDPILRLYPGHHLPALIYGIFGGKKI